MSPQPAPRDPGVTNEDRYRALLERLSTFVWIADARGEFITPQPGWEKYTGHGFEQHGGAGWISDVHPDDRAHVAKVWKQAVESKSWYEVAWRCWHGASQTWRHCITRGTPVTDRDDVVREWIGSVLDIEDRVDLELKRVQSDLAGANRQLASNLETMTRLQQLSTRLVSAGELKVLLGEILDTALDLTAAEKGNIQLLQDGSLGIVEQRGFDTAFLDYFDYVEHGTAACGTAVQWRQRVIIENVAASPIFAATPALDVLLAAGVRAVQSTPLFSRSGQLLGMFSTHYSTPHAPAEYDLRVLDLLARQAADLIERAITERAREQANEELNLSLKAGKAGTFDWDARRDINRWSDQLLTLYGIKRSEFGGSTHDWRAAVFPDDRERAIAALERSLQTGEFDVDFRIVRRDNGEVRWMHGAGQVFFENGKPARMVGINVDITDQKRAEERLKQSEAQFRRLVESNIVGIVIANEKRIIDANDLYLDLLGNSREDLLAGRIDWVKATPPDSYQRDLEGLRELREHGVCKPYEKEYVRLDGTRVPILIGAAALPGYDELTWICFTVDLTGQKSLENALVSANEELRRTTRLLDPVACFVRDLDDRIIYWSPGAAQLYGYSREEAIGEVCHELLNTEFPAPVNDIVSQMHTAGVWNGELVYTCRDGKRITVVTHWALHCDAANRPAAVLEVNLDITGRKTAELELRRVNLDLEQFAHSVSHDLQEPLRTVKIYSELLTRNCGNKLDGEALEALRFVRAGATRLERLLRDLLTYTQAQRFEPVAEPTSADECLAAALENLAQKISETGATIHAGALPSVRVHAAHLRQLFQNLVGNALKYRKNGVPPAVQVSAEIQDGAWRFAVNDNGIGIEAVFKERVFGLFKRLHADSDIDGTGIGLALCHRILEHYGGRIWVESEPGVGSTFYFTVPS